VWCSNLRCRKETLSPEQIAQLDAIGFTWDIAIDLWNKRYTEMVAFKEINGHCNATRKDNNTVGIWAANQRVRKARLSAEQIALLDALGFCWDFLAAECDKGYAALIAFKEVNGHCDAKRSDGYAGQWCNNVRARRRKNTLSTEQIEQLDSIGFCWEPLRDRWNKHIAELVAFKRFTVIATCLDR
jgi:hypothetical protein